MDFCYRDGNIDDIEDVFRLNRAVFDEAWSKQVMLQSLQVGYDLYVCYAKNVLLGYVLSQDILLETQIMQVCVHQDFRRLGIAKQLMQTLIKNKQGMQTLMLEVRASNVVAQGFYQSLGFKQAGIRSKYYAKTNTQPREDAVVFHLAPSV